MLSCAKEEKSSPRWIEEQFVQVHPGMNVIESGGQRCSEDKRGEVVGVKEMDS